MSSPLFLLKDQSSKVMNLHKVFATAQRGAATIYGTVSEARPAAFLTGAHTYSNVLSSVAELNQLLRSVPKLLIKS